MIQEARHALKHNNSVLLQLPTGGGKTVLASSMLGGAAEKGKRSWFICHRRELVDQTAGTFKKFGIDFGFIASGYPFNPNATVQICSIDTLKGRVLKMHPEQLPDLAVWDETHHIAAAGWSRVKDYLTDAKHVGLSATPQRLDGKGLGEWFDHMAIGPSVEELMRRGFLSDYKVFAPITVDLSGIHTRMGDYVKSELEGALDTRKITGDIVRHWKKYAQGKKTIGFAVSVKHSEHIVEAFLEAGVRAKHLDGKTNKLERKQATIAFARGEIDVLFNVDLFGEGYDLAAQAGMDVTVESVILARPTQSLALHLQQIGRALRRKDYPAIILDHAGNCMRHGLPDDERDWSLYSTKRKRKKSDDDGTVQAKQCPTCFYVHKPSPTCPNCGHVYEVANRDIEHVDGELVELDKEALRREKKREQGQARTLEDLITLGISRGYKNPRFWAQKIMQSRQGKGF